MSENTHPEAPETRTIDVDVGSLDTRGRTVHGYAAVYGVESEDLGGFRERIAPGAFSGVLDSDVRALLNHDPNEVLGRTRSGTLRLADDQRGLRFELDLPDSPLGENVRSAVGRGDLDGASFRFEIGEEEWAGDLRTVRTVKQLRDVTLATYPAYPAASIELRTRPVNDGGERRQEGAEMATEDQDGAAEERSAEHENEDRTEERAEGALQVEDRHVTAEERSLEERVTDALREVQKGESRALSNAAAISREELSNFLFDSLRAQSIALASGIQVIVTDRQSIEWPKLSADVTPAFYDENAVITAGDPGFVTLTATPAKIAHRVEASNEVIDDSDPSVVDVLRTHLAALLGLTLDAAIYEGSGTAPEITGMSNTTGVQVGQDITNAGAAANGFDPVIDAWYLLKEANAPEPYVIAAPPLTYRALAVLRNGTNDEQLSVPREWPATFSSTQLTDAYMYSPSQVVLVRRTDVEVELDRSRLFDQDASEVRGKLRADLLLPNPEAVVRLPNNTV